MAIDTATRIVSTDAREIPYDILIVATGARHAYFGHDEWKSIALGLKKIEDATGIRRQSCCRSNSPRVLSIQRSDGGY
jgi:NADH dehydrogenase